MATMIEKAACGQRSAMEYLYGQNKQKVFYAAQSLLLNENQAADAVIWVFQNIWSSISAPGISTEEEFADTAIEMAVEYCRKKVSKQNSKAFRTPPNKNFLISNIGAYDGSEPYADFILRQFSELQRFIFVSHAVCKSDSVQAAKLIKFSQNLMPIALEAEKSNIEKLLAAAGAENYSYEKLLGDFAENAKNAAVPSKADQQVMTAIDGIAKPFEQKKKKKMTLYGIVAAACICAVIGLAFLFGTGSENTDSNAPILESEAVAPDSGTETASSLDASLAYYADIEIQDYGTITVQLDQQAAPITTENFVNLANSGFYNGLTFHRIMEGFMMQGGDPEGTGMGGSEHTITGEFSANGYDNSLSHTRGAIAMARSNDYDSASSQFYIVHQDSLFLDGQYAVFGYVTEGMEIVDAICESAEPTDDNGTIPAESQPVISSITIRTE